MAYSPPYVVSLRYDDRNSMPTIFYSLFSKVFYFDSVYTKKHNCTTAFKSKSFPTYPKAKVNILLGANRPRCVGESARGRKSQGANRLGGETAKGRKSQIPNELIDRQFNSLCCIL